MTVFDKQGRMIDVDHCGGAYKISPRQRDTIYQEFLRAFPLKEQRRALLREHADDKNARRQIRQWIQRQAPAYRISADRITSFISEAIATEIGILPKRERWDWWVGCSLK